MTAFDNAKKFFEACEAPSGWSACKDYVADGATFIAQSEPLVDVNTVEAYSEWMFGFATVTTPGATYDLHTSSYDEDNNCAVFYATYNGKHSGDGGPVPPTGKETHTDYVYVLKMNSDNKVEHMTKIWNAPWAMKELGWM